MKLVGVSHLHTTYSYDGSLTLKELKELLVSKSINFVFVTEHSDEIDPTEGVRFIKECHNLSDSTITIIPGFEVPYKDSHILMLGVSHFLKNGPNSSQDLKSWRKYAKLAVWAHPHRNKYLQYDALVGVIDGVEIWNSQYDGKFTPRFKAINSLRSMNARGMNLFALCGLDFHREEHIGGPKIVVEDVMQKEDAIINVIKSGDFKIEIGNTVFDSKGRLLHGKLNVLKLKSFISIAIITTSKKINKFAASMRLPLPEKFRKKIRSKI